MGLAFAGLILGYLFWKEFRAIGLSPVSRGFMDSHYSHRSRLLHRIRASIRGWLFGVGGRFAT